MTAVGFLSGCAVPGSSPTHETLDDSRGAITDGDADLAGDGVVGVVRDGVLVCSGVAVSPRVVVTAGHCVDLIAPDAVFVGRSVAAGGTFVPVVYARPFDGFDRATLSNDVAVLVLGSKYEGPTAAVATRALTPTDVGTSVVVAGYGATEAGDAGGSPTARRGVSRIASYTPMSVAITPAPSLPCSGDSGGPAFWGDTLGWMGIVSSGDAACSASASLTRVDAFATQIDAWISLASEGAAQPGGRCFYDASCAEGACVTPSDSSFAYCSVACTLGGSPCPDAMQCATSTCIYPSPSPGALGASCASSDDCAVGTCAMGTCAAPCVPAGSTCAGDRICAPVGDSGAHACVAPEAMAPDASTAPAQDAEVDAEGPSASGGGCSNAPGPARAPIAPVVAILMLVGWRRRQRRSIHTLDAVHRRQAWRR